MLSSSPRATTNLAGSCWNLVGGSLTPFVTVSVSPSLIIPGQAVSVSGTVESKPSSGLAVWDPGENFTDCSPASVDNDGTYGYNLSEALTSGMTPGQYFVIVQHPMQNDIFDVIRQETPWWEPLRSGGRPFSC